MEKFRISLNNTKASALIHFTSIRKNTLIKRAKPFHW